MLALKPFAAKAQHSIGAALAEFRQAEPGMQVDAAVTALRLVDIEYDSKIMRIVAEAEGNVRVAVSSLPRHCWIAAVGNEAAVYPQPTKTPATPARMLSFEPATSFV